MKKRTLLLTREQLWALRVALWLLALRQGKGWVAKQLGEVQVAIAAALRRA